MDLYRVVASLFVTGWRAFDLDVQSSGHENIPVDGPVILASNHIGYLDFCFVALSPPQPRRPVRFLVRHDVFDRRVVGFLLHRLRQVPIDVYGDPRPGLTQAARFLEEGEVVGVHPEGTISPSFVPRRGRTGTIRLAQRVGAPIVPVALWGSHRLMTKWRSRTLRRGVAVRVHYGEPYVPAPGKPVAGTRDLMARINELLASAQAAYPQQPAPAEDDWWVPAHLGGSAPTPEEAEQRLRRQAEGRRKRAALHGPALTEPASSATPGPDDDSGESAKAG